MQQEENIVRRRKRSIKPLLFLVALLVAVGITTAGTVAWLVDTTDSITNTFTTSDVSITLTESDDLDLKMIPGHTITKDPKVTVKANSEKCYVFVKLEKDGNFDTYMTYEMAVGWTELSGNTDNTGVYYRVVETSDKDQDFDVLKNNQVTVLDTVTKKMMGEITTASQPTLKVTAYACQYNKNATEYFSATEAWGNINSSLTTS